MEKFSDPARAGLGAVLDTALDAVVVMRLDGTVAAWNTKAERLFGWSYAEVHGRQLSELVIPPQYREAHHEGLSRFHETGEGPVLDRHIEITAVDRGGREFPVELSITHTAHFGERVFIGFIRDITERQEAAARQERMVRELNHRVKNMLAVVSAIAQQTARSSTDMAGFQDAFMGRLQSLGRAHDILVRAEWESASLHSLADHVLGAEVTAGRAACEGPDIRVGPRHLLGLSMVLHELYTNAVKYGALSLPEGTVSLQWELAPGGELLEVRWKESGMSRVEPPQRSGFGHKMIAMSVRHDLRGEFQTDWPSEGLKAVLRFPADGEERHGTWG